MVFLGNCCERWKLSKFPFQFPVGIPLVLRVYGRKFARIVFQDERVLERVARLGKQTVSRRRGEAIPLLYISLPGLQSITETSCSHSISIVKYSRPFRATSCASARGRCRTLQFKGRRLRTICFRRSKDSSRARWCITLTSLCSRIMWRLEHFCFWHPTCRTG
jgi:hypothetical protein